MQVQQILNSKTTSDVITIKPNSLIVEAIKVLADKKIGTVIVSLDGVSAEGILSERDIVRELAKTGVNCLNRAVDELMTKNLQTCEAHTSAEEVMQKMIKGRFRHMPVVEKDKLIGLITLGDAVKARLSELSMEKDALESMIMGF